MHKNLFRELLLLINTNIANIKIKSLNNLKKTQKLKKQTITKLIETIRQETQNDNFELLKSKVEELKLSMKEVVTANQINDNDSNSDPMSDLNDF